MANISASLVCLFSLFFFFLIYFILLGACAWVCMCGGGYHCCITGMLIVFFTSLVSLASHALLKHACVGGMPSFALLTLPFALPALRYWHVKLGFLYQPCVTVMSSLAFFTSLALVACQALLSLPALRYWHVKLSFLY